MNSEKSGKKMLGLGLLFIALVGFSAYNLINSGESNNQAGQEEALDEIINELTTTYAADLPEYAFNSKRTQTGYLIALQMSDALERVPCYCSCSAIGHESLKDCFLEGDAGFEEHASYCDLCVSEALDVYTWQKQGISMEEIRSRIDEKYSKYGEPTDTPKI